MDEKQIRYNVDIWSSELGLIGDDMTKAMFLCQQIYDNYFLCEDVSYKNSEAVRNDYKIMLDIVIDYIVKSKKLSKNIETNMDKILDELNEGIR